MELIEWFVTYVQWMLPTWLLHLLVRLNMAYFCFMMRRGDVVVRQIQIDRRDRKNRPVTTEVATTNEQLYGNDAAFFKAHLGPKLKYSACKFDEGDTLKEAEQKTIKEYQDKAGLKSLPDGSRVLELGCGWGSLSLENAVAFPKLQFVGFSNSPQQIEYIRGVIAERGIKNLVVHVEDYADFVKPERSKVAPAGSPPFDCAIAIETIEHAQNIEELLAAVADRLKPGSSLFVQSLLHQCCSYLMDQTSWMGRNFFTGGSILSLNSYFHLAPPNFRIVEVEPIYGIGYSKTLLAWLAKMEGARPDLVKMYGRVFYEGFRMFYISTAEAFAANKGTEFMVAYYTFLKC
ncbi:hypothetical protein AB1Y20_011398 [Prymnesium parvum]|uniref:Cyclopropane-fatty-acyl-phospholipid synthase n=1 Tax=Prymnesium parvum TaxID=97485 RepID=A0AB34ILR9_PRYPA|mmetsp:Transcript_35597/g.88574  ORF Transcript_35597/g.88574 Transcript_35597/m.88574 type:complete len:346 (-) Transcript_35597:308-1345(-)